MRKGFTPLVRVASDPVTKLQLVSLGDDYSRQADDLRLEEPEAGEPKIFGSNVKVHGHSAT